MTQDILAIKKARFDQLWDMIRQAGFDASVFPEESKIRLEANLVSGTGQYIFNLKDIAATDGVVTHALERNDVFVPNAWGVMLSIVNNTTGVEKLYSYAPINDGVNPSIHEAGFTTNEIENLFNGILSWTVDNNVALSAYPMERFKHVPETQGAFVLDSNDAPVREGIQSEFNLDDMLQIIMPRYVIAGTRDHKMQVNFPATGRTFAVTAGYTAKLVLMLDGFLVKGGCEYKGGSGVNPFGQAVGQW